MAQQPLNALEDRLGHSFRENQLLIHALTHRSLVHEQAQEVSGEEAGAPSPDNERLEFLGDAILGLVVAETLYRRFPEMGEGQWTRLRASLVSRQHMAAVAAAIDLGLYLRLGRGEERSGGRKKAALLANSLEAVLGALYLDGGLEPVAGFVNRHVIAPYLTGLRTAMDAGVSLGDHKSALQEMLQARKAGTPKYILKAESGPDHHKRFLVEVRVSPGGSPVTLARGIGMTKKQAEQEAARRGLIKLRKQDHDQSAILALGSGF
ncbi:MAG TPA: ribonuclease III [Acidobacteriaceae bacterium]|jgi:ribonuclease-3|nr:ribonuclease III [Acidobacteriaceae bacterium]